MGAYLKAVFDHLHSELSGAASNNGLEAKWLHAMLKRESADWWLLAASARTACAKLATAATVSAAATTTATAHVAPAAQAARAAPAAAAADDEPGYVGGGETDGDADDPELTAADVELLRAATAAAVAGDWKAMGGLLDVVPASIIDVYSSVLGDGFHFMDRPKVPIHHESKKAYFHALQEAWFAWDPVKLEEVKVALRISMREEYKAQRFSRWTVNEISADIEAKIEARMYYDVAWFRERVPRVVLPPSLLYPRVRAVYQLYGTKVDSKINVPLFNKTNWGRANNVPKEIIARHASDPPGFSFYS